MPKIETQEAPAAPAEPAPALTFVAKPIKVLTGKAAIAQKAHCGYDEAPFVGSCGNCDSFRSDKTVPAWAYRDESVKRKFEDGTYAKIEKRLRCAVQTHTERAGLRTDADLIEQYVRERCSASANTEASYRAQLRRLGWFCRHIGLRSIRDLQREQWADYRAYLRAPPVDHIMAASVGFNERGWRPFRGPLSERSAKQAEIVGRGFFAWLSDPAIGALQVDPVRSIRTSTTRRSATVAGVERYLNVAEQGLIQRAIDDLPAGTPRQIRAKARARWIVSLAVLTGLRASEIASARRSDIRPSQTAGAFNLQLVRKGGVESTLPLNSGVLIAWREHLSQYDDAALSAATDLPLVLPLRDKDLRPPVKGPTRPHVWRIIKDVVLAAADLARDAGDQGSEMRLRHASTHWLRHTFATNLLERGADLLAVRDLMDHASVTTTNQYLHKPEEKLREAVEKL